MHQGLVALRLGGIEVEHKDDHRSPGTIDELMLFASVEQDFDGMARDLVALIKDYFAGTKPGKKWYKINGKLITPENAAQ